MSDFWKEQLSPAHYAHFMCEKLHTFKRYDHISKLHELGFLPLAIYSLPEGAMVPEKVPAMVMYNTTSDSYWLTNALETILSCTVWGPSTSATMAHQYRKLLDSYAAKTSDIPEFVDYQAHDFSFRGMYGLEAAILSGMAHLLYFKGTDTIPAIIESEGYNLKSLGGATSVPATEHSVMCAYGKENELATYAHLINDVYPSGIVSIVSDTWDLWNVIDNLLPQLKDDIMGRDGKVVIRPDSGDPIKIMCGDPNGKTESECKGVIERLWEIFGGIVNSKGYKQLDAHIGAIYGDSITLDRCKEILERLEEKGFASTNIVFGIGSYTYQYNTRDTLGWAMKATYVEVNGEGRAIYKQPKTDDGTKNSAKGLIKVIKENGNYKAIENVTWEEFHMPDNELQLVFKDGEMYDRNL